MKCKRHKQHVTVSTSENVQIHIAEKPEVRSEFISLQLCLGFNRFPLKLPLSNHLGLLEVRAWVVPDCIQSLR